MCRICSQWGKKLTVNKFFYKSIHFDGLLQVPASSDVFISVDYCVIN